MGLQALYENDDPAIPSIYRLALPPGIGTLGGLAPTPVLIPFQAQDGAPFGHIGAGGLYVPSGRDTQSDYSNNHHWFGFSLVNTGPQ